MNRNIVETFGTHRSSKVQVNKNPFSIQINKNLRTTLMKFPPNTNNPPAQPILDSLAIWIVVFKLSDNTARNLPHWASWSSDAVFSRTRCSLVTTRENRDATTPDRHGQLLCLSRLEGTVASLAAAAMLQASFTDNTQSANASSSPALSI
jgi:hypothetical protein